MTVYLLFSYLPDFSNPLHGVYASAPLAQQAECLPDNLQWIQMGNDHRYTANDPGRLRTWVIVGWPVEGLETNNGGER